MRHRWNVIFLAAFILPAAAAAQSTPRVASRPGLTNAGARAVLAAGLAEARRLGASGGAVAVVDEGGALLLLERLDGTFAAAAGVAEGKARTAALFRRATSGLEDAILGGRTTLLNVAETPLQGGVPLVVDGVVVGAVGVSGATSAAQDTEIAVAAAQAMLTGAADDGSEEPVEVAYLESGTVQAAFQRGAPLLEVRDYKVHASRRTEAGKAEVHERDTDIIYVLEGGATFVTGGDVVDGMTVATEEIRGAAIRGGTTRTLRKGDVVVVPAGTPHWFSEVTGPFLYYVVKVSGSGRG